MLMLRSFWRSNRLRVDFPAPDGEAITSKVPRRVADVEGLASFDILHLLPKLLHQGFEIHANRRQCNIVGFCADRIGFAG